MFVFQFFDLSFCVQDIEGFAKSMFVSSNESFYRILEYTFNETSFLLNFFKLSSIEASFIFLHILHICILYVMNYSFKKN